MSTNNLNIHAATPATTAPKPQQAPAQARPTQQGGKPGELRK